MITDKDISKLEQVFLTKREIKGFLTKDDAKSLLTKDDVRNFLTKDDAKSFLTKDDAKNFLTKDDAKNFLTKDDAKDFLTKKDSEKFATKKDMEKFEGNVALGFTDVQQQINGLKADVGELKTRFDVMEDHIIKAIDDLRSENLIVSHYIPKVNKHDTKIEDHEVRITALETKVE